MSIAIGIVAHPQRLVYAERLQAQVNADFIGMDDGRGAYTNHVNTWTELAGSGSDFAVVLEDDCVPTVNFTGQLAKALAACPANICSLYTGRLRPPQHQDAIKDGLDKAAANDACWMISNRLFHAVAVAIRADLIPTILAGLHSYLPIDEAIGAAARRTGEPIAHSVPSLVDHNDILPTLTRHRDGQPRTPGRVAWQVGTRKTWTSQAVTL